MTFDLWSDPWIRVRRHDGTMEDLGILDVLDLSADITRLAGEIPTQDAAILRLLLAILYRAVPVDGKGPRDKVAIDAWSEVWREGRLPMAPIRAYADRFRERFDLTSSTSPFFQVADLRTASGRTSGLGKLVAEVPDGATPMFTRRAEVTSLSLAEAARWVVHCQAFDPSGIKSGAEGDPRVKGGKGYPIGTGWAGAIGLVILEGESLFATLMLNLDLSLRSDDDRPVWELPPQGPQSEESRTPVGPADLLTWQIRRIRLIVDGGRVVDCLISNGDRITLADKFTIEPMSAWRMPKTGPNAGHVMPSGHTPERGIWRGLEVTLREPGRRSSMPPMRSQEWLAGLLSHRVLPPGAQIRLHAVGLTYGSNNSVISGAIDDRLTLHAGVLSSQDAVALVKSSLSETAEAVQQVSALAGNLVAAVGGSGDSTSAARSSAREAAYARLEPLFREWVGRLDVATDVEAQRESWRRVAYRELLALGQQMVLAAGPAAAAGTFVTTTRGGVASLIDAAIAERWFRVGLRKALDLHEVESAGRGLQEGRP